jgi:citrate lyase subunit beta/citryl-CoA lyase
MSSSPDAPQPMIARSFLFVPGDRPDRFDKALAAGADAVIVDLEDAVAPAKKDEARAAIRNWLSATKPVLLRINADTTPWYADDLELARAPEIAGILLSKAQTIDHALQALSSQTGKVLLPQIETAQGFENAYALASTPGVQRLLFGTLDFQMDLGIDGEGDELAYFRSEMVLVSRLAGIQPPVDGPSTVLDDAAQLSSDTRRARRMGFGAKLCIHPKQVAPVNAAFAAHRRRTGVGATRGAGSRRLQWRGRRVGRPHGGSAGYSEGGADRARSSTEKDVTDKT